MKSSWISIECDHEGCHEELRCLLGTFNTEGKAKTLDPQEIVDTLREQGWLAVGDNQHRCYNHGLKFIGIGLKKNRSHESRG